MVQGIDSSLFHSVNCHVAGLTRRSSAQCSVTVYTVSKSDTDVAHYNFNAVNQFWYFLAEILLRDYAIEW